MKVITFLGLTGVLAATTALAFDSKSDDKYSKSLMEQLTAILQQDPKDNQFGLTRLPTIHGKPSFHPGTPEEKKAIESYEALENTNALMVSAFGKFQDGRSTRHRNMPYQDKFTTERFKDPKQFSQDVREFYMKAGPDNAAKLYASSKNESKFEVTIGGQKSVVYMKKVFPSSKRCLDCHEEMGAGKPVGVLTLLRVPYPQK